MEVRIEARVIALPDGTNLGKEADLRDVLAVVPAHIARNRFPVHFLDECLEKTIRRAGVIEFDRRTPVVLLLIGEVKVLDHVQTIGRQMREEGAEGGDDVLANMAAVIDDDFEWAISARDFVEGVGIVLIALEDRDARLLEMSLVAEVEPEDLAPPEKVLPRPERGPALLRLVAAYPDLEELDLRAPPRARMRS
jgi:hypothetical protein